MQRTKIPYLTHSWNPIAMRCTPISKGCAGCWHLKLCDRFAKNPIFSKEVQAAYAGGKPVLLEDELLSPLSKKKPCIIGVQFMGDLFHNEIPYDWIDKVMAVISLCPHHDFYLLTKRVDEMAEYFGNKDRDGYIGQQANMILDGNYFNGDDIIMPLPNLHLGLTVCTQKEADEKIPILLQILAAHRWLSIEPMLEDIRLTKWLCDQTCEDWGICHGKLKSECSQNNIDRVVVGCESGAKRRPCKIEWIRSIVQQCRAASVKCFVKQISMGGCKRCRFEPCTHLHGHKHIDIVSHNPAEWPEDLRIQETK